jgi:hypothetical protein
LRPESLPSCSFQLPYPAKIKSLFKNSVQLIKEIIIFATKEIRI